MAAVAATKEEVETADWVGSLAAAAEGVQLEVAAAAKGVTGGAGVS